MKLKLTIKLDSFLIELEVPNKVTTLIIALILLG